MANGGRVTRRSRRTRQIVERGDVQTTAHRTPAPAMRHFPERLRLLDGVDPLRPERPPVRRSHYSEERTSSPARHSFGAFVRRSAIHTKRTSSIKVMRENANDATRSPRRARGPSPKNRQHSTSVDESIARHYRCVHLGTWTAFKPLLRRCTRRVERRPRASRRFARRRRAAGRRRGGLAFPQRDLRSYAARARRLDDVCERFERRA